MTSNTFVKNVEHESAIKHVTGRAIYTDDISEPRNLLHAAIGFSPVSKGIIEKIDFSKVLKSNGLLCKYDFKHHAQSTCSYIKTR